MVLVQGFLVEFTSCREGMWILSCLPDTYLIALYDQVIQTHFGTKMICFWVCCFRLTDHMNVLCCVDLRSWALRQPARPVNNLFIIIFSLSVFAGPWLKVKFWTSVIIKLDKFFFFFIHFFFVSFILVIKLIHFHFGSEYNNIIPL